MTVDILLVDDNAIQAATRKAILTRSGRSVAVACDAEKALAMLDATGSARPVGLVVTDHLMPGMHGPEFVTLLRARFPLMPVLVLSGMPDAEDSYDNLDVVFRVKPLPPEELLALARSLLMGPIARTA
ncbi:MAG TPA: response regulator [Acidobacteriaceae bacterium]|jgi:DNA-binding response OmpR family regulator|nr:response regulator [Acidobacteriaceae bacterium]